MSKHKQHLPDEHHSPAPAGTEGARGKPRRTLEIVLKCDSPGSQEAILASLPSMENPEVAVKVIHADIGPVSKSDLFLAPTGSRLVVGFNVDTMPRIPQMCKEFGVEVRLYEVIYNLIEDLRNIADSWKTREAREVVTGQANVIALFKSGGKGIIIGCEVKKGSLALGKTFRIISAMGPVYTGTIDSLHIEQDTVNEAGVGKQVGLKLNDFKKVKIGDMVECFRVVEPDAPKPWAPKSEVFRFGKQQ